MSDTIFMKIINGEIPATKLYEDEHVLAFEDVNPQAPKHVLVIPKKTIATANDIEPEDAELIGRLFLVAKQVAVDLGVDKDGYRLVMNCNAAGGQTVYHLHLHLMAGRNFSWPPG